MAAALSPAQQAAQERLLKHLPVLPIASGALKMLVGDASTRIYFRIRSGAATSIAAVYPLPAQAEVARFVEVRDLFDSAGLRVPDILAVDEEAGILLLEDLGDESLQVRLTRAPEEAGGRLRQALDLIFRLQTEGRKKLRPDQAPARHRFDYAKLRWELDFFSRHFMGDFLGELPTPAAETEFHDLCTEMAGFRDVLCHRDYQVRNLLVTGDSLAVIDFQDARMGPPVYDAVSLLLDTIDLPEDVLAGHMLYAMENLGFVERGADFYRQFWSVAVQRLLKALGTYGYQSAVAGKASYRLLIPSTVRRLRLAIEKRGGLPGVETLVESWG